MGFIYIDIFQQTLSIANFYWAFATTLFRFHSFTLDVMNRLEKPGGHLCAITSFTIRTSLSKATLSFIGFCLTDCQMA